jgi:cellulose synthase/poly-beta-1,6-N-acetylglucosamine synthase-like glycosyltransferase
MGELICIFDAD